MKFQLGARIENDITILINILRSEQNLFHDKTCKCVSRNNKFENWHQCEYDDDVNGKLYMVISS